MIMWKKVLGWTALVIFGLIALFFLIVLLYPIPEPNEVAVAEASVISYDDGTEIAALGEVQRINVPLSEVPDHVQKAVLAAEDRSFYEHGGISIAGIARAAVNNITGGETQGGSTITQQYVKNVFLTSDQTFIRKIKEMILSIKMEWVLSKDEILEGYMNTIYLGRGAYGFEAASNVYYDKSVSELDVAEGAALAGIIQSPSFYEPTENPEGVQLRFDYVIDGMVEEGWLPAAEAATLEVPEFIPPPTGNELAGQVGHISQEVRNEMSELGFDDAEIAGGGYRITTTIQQQAQDAIESAVATQGPQSGTEGLRIGVVGVDPKTGSIVAMYGGPDYVEDQFNNATQGRAQAGSTFKAFGLVAAFEDGIGLDTIWDGNSPRTISGYTVPNQGNQSFGDVSLLTATERSINTVFVDVEDTTGVRPLMDAAVAAGVPSDTPGWEENLTFVLGTASPHTIDMASAYGTFANRGSYVEPTIIKEVKTSGGTSVYRQDPSGENRISAFTSDEVNYALESVVTNGTGSTAQALGRPSAGKTGTTDENKSAWYVGYTPQLSAAVSFSKEDANGNTITLSGTGGLGSVSGGSFPAAIWTSFAIGFHEGLPVEDFNEPVGIALPTATPSESESESESPSESPSESETPEPSDTPTVEPSPSLPPEPTQSPTPEPSGSPTGGPSEQPTSDATAAATP